MTTKVKGLLKGLRYSISHNIFDEKEPEIEIGFPTDVKHVAHIGCDGPSSTTPSWMNEFKSSPESMSGPLNPMDDLKSLPSSPKAQSEAGGSTHKSKNKSRRSSSDAPKHSRRSSNASSAAGSPAGSPKAADGERKSRRHRSSNNMTMGSPARESSGGGSVKSRKTKKSSNQGDESPTASASASSDQPSIPKHSRTRKSRARSKDHPENSTPADVLPPTADGGSTKSTTAGHLTSVLDAYQEER